MNADDFARQKGFIKGDIGEELKGYIVTINNRIEMGSPTLLSWDPEKYIKLFTDKEVLENKTNCAKFKDKVTAYKVKVTIEEVIYETNSTTKEEK